MTVTVACPECDADVEVTLAGYRWEGFHLEDVEGECPHVAAYNLADARDHATMVYEDKLCDRAVDAAERNHAW